MENKKEYCERLFKKYKELKEETRTEAHEISKSTGEIAGKYIPPEKMEERDKTKEELKKRCRDFLSPEQLFELEEN